METRTPAPTPSEEKKPLFDTIVISTPVLLTVIATFVLGRSSSEMTQAQYHRAVAGQSQSKVADQWAFFQAKRTRGTTYETTAVGLVAQNAEPFITETLIENSQALLQEIQASVKELTPRDDKLREPFVALEKRADGALEQVHAALQPGSEGWKGKRTLLTVASVKTALAALEAYPADGDAKLDDEDTLDADQRKLLDEILDDIRKFKPEKETSPKTLALTEATVHEAMKRARARAARIAERSKAIDLVLEEFDILVDKQTALSRELHRHLTAQLTAMAKANGEVKELTRLQERLNRVRTQSAKLLGDYKAARYAFDARRYEEDARANQEAAFLYDVEVLQSSARSDRHLKRSFGFMIAMLIAQVGVTIASLAMAMTRKVPVWAMAALSGVVAILYGVYVFLELGPF